MGKIALSNTYNNYRNFISRSILNSNCKLDGKLITNRKLINCQLRDIISESDKSFLSVDNINEMFETQFNFLSGNALMMSIPKEWRIRIKNEEPNWQNHELIETDIDKLCKANRPVKVVYEQLLYKHTCKHPDTMYAYWSQSLGANLSEDIWCAARSNSYYLTKSIKHRYFQFRLMSNKLITRARRSQWDKTVNPICIYCESFLETPMHILWECSGSEKVLEEFCQMVQVYM